MEWTFQADSALRGAAVIRASEMSHVKRAALVAAAVIALIGTIALVAQPQTPGKRFREWMSHRAPICEAYSEELRKGSPDCRILAMKPEDPLATEEGRFAHAIKLPPPHDKPKDVYRHWMKPAEYFEALCKAEAGEFIFRTVENVEGIVLLRQRTHFSDEESNHLFAAEDPYGGPMYVRPGLNVNTWVNPYRYAFAETFALTQLWLPFGIGTIHESYNAKPQQHDRVARFHYETDGQAPGDWRKTFAPKPTARYGITWRGIRREQDRELGIAGGELIVLDLETNEVIAFRRGFTATGWNTARPWRDSPSVSWKHAGACPLYSTWSPLKESARVNPESTRSRDLGFDFWFVSKVLVPPPSRRDRFAFQVPLFQQRP